MGDLRRAAHLAGDHHAPGLGAIFSGFTLVYLVLSAMTIWLLRRLATGAPAIQSARPELAVAA